MTHDEFTMAMFVYIQQHPDMMQATAEQLTMAIAKDHLEINDETNEDIITLQKQLMKYIEEETF